MDVPLYFGQRMSAGGPGPRRHARARRPGEPRARGGRRGRRRGGAGRVGLGRVPAGPDPARARRRVPRRGGPVALVAHRLRPADRRGGGARPRARVPGLGEGRHHGRRGRPRAPHAVPGLAARRMVVLGSGPLGLAVAPSRARAGSRCPPWSRSARRSAATRARGALERQGVRFYPSHVVAAALGSRDEIEGVRLAALDGDLRPIPGRELDVACDTVCLAIGLVPQVELLQILGCRLVFRSERGGFVPEIDAEQRTSLPEVFAAGDVAGVDERAVMAPERAVAGAARGPRRRRLARSHRAGPGAGPPARDPVPASRAGAPGPRLLAAVAPRHARGGRMGHPRLPVRGGHAGRAGRRPAPALSRPALGPHARPERRTLSQDGPLHPDQVSASRAPAWARARAGDAGSR